MKSGEGLESTPAEKHRCIVASQSRPQVGGKAGELPRRRINQPPLPRLQGQQVKNVWDWRDWRDWRPHPLNKDKRLVMDDEMRTWT